MATQTGSYDFKSTKAAKETAEKVATNFVATDSSGMMVYDGTSGTHTPSNPGSTTRNVLIDSDSVDIRQGTDVLATFGATTRIGKDNSDNIKITSSPSKISVNSNNMENALVMKGEWWGQDQATGGIYFGGEDIRKVPRIRGYYSASDSSEDKDYSVLTTWVPANDSVDGYIDIWASNGTGPFDSGDATTEYGSMCIHNNSVVLKSEDPAGSSRVELMPGGDMELEANTIYLDGQPLLITASTAYYDAQKENGDFKARFGCGSNNGRHGIYSSSSAGGIDSKWIIMRDQTGDIFVGGTTAAYKLAAWVNDYGTNYDWTYRKYSDRTFDAWGTFTVTPTSSTASGSIYYSNAISVNLPFTASSGSVIVTGSVGSQYAWLVNTSAATTTVSFRIARGAAISTSTALSVRLHVFGEY